MEQTTLGNNIGALLIKAYAKVNFSLFAAKKTQGFHPISSLAAPIDIFDRIRLIPAEKSSVEIALKADCFGNFNDVPEEDNTALKALNKYNEHFGTKHSYKIIIDKRIPVGGGLGGSSADAAGIIRLLSYMDQRNKSDLLDLAADIGKDVPFMLYGSTAIMSGFGEKVELLPALNMDITLIYVPQPNSTAEVYSEYDRTPETFEPNESLALYNRLVAFNSDFNNGKMTLEEYAKGTDNLGFYNALTAAASRLNPKMAEIIDKLHSKGIKPIMTGSGSFLYLPYYCDLVFLRRLGIRAINIRTI